MLLFLEPLVFQVGKKFDVLDLKNKWCVATIKRIQGRLVYFGYDGWAINWDEWIPMSSHRIAIAGTYQTLPRGLYKWLGDRKTCPMCMESV